MALPPRTDLRTRRERLAARAMLGGLSLSESLTARLLVDVRPPAEDPFHGEREQLDGMAPGTILDSRPVEVRAFRRVIDTDAWQVAIRSTDSHGDPVSAMTTVMIPRRPFVGPVRPLLSYQCAIDSLGAAADPSHTFRRGNQLELPLIARALRRGWAIVATDHTGPKHAFGASGLAAHLVLDGIRAALSFEPPGLDATAPIGLWGYSGGAQATLAAAERQAGYAPDLNIVGVAAGGMTVDPTTMDGSFEDAYDGSVLSGIPLGAVIGIGREHRDVDLLGALTPRGREIVASAAGMTVEQLFMSYPFLHWSEYLTVPSVLDIPGLRAAFEANRLGQAAPTAKLYLYHGIHEQNLPIADADRFVEGYRQSGADVTYDRVRLGEHMVVAVTGARGALRFLGQRFGAGDSGPDG